MNYYLKNLDGLRFVAALMVIISHVELFKIRLGLESFYDNYYISNLGTFGVNFFFVLSGFLITYLLLIEETKRSKIDYKKFLLRRVLRIWPLYYTIILLVFFILPAINFPSIPGYSLSTNFIERFILCIFFLPNFSKAYFEFIPYGGILWSIGVEEQFYLLWPAVFLVKKVKRVSVILSLILIIVLIKGVFTLPLFSEFDNFKNLLTLSRFELLMIGGLFAFLRSKLQFQLINTNHIWLVFWSLTFLLIILPKKYDHIFHLLSAPFFGSIILLISNIKKRLLFELPVLKYFGKISYGIYMYHMMIAGFVLHVLNNFYSKPSGIFYNLLLYSLTLSLTLLISHLSYTYLEKPFLKIKLKYTYVNSRDV